MRSVPPRKRAGHRRDDRKHLDSPQPRLPSREGRRRESLGCRSPQGGRHRTGTRRKTRDGRSSETSSRAPHEDEVERLDDKGVLEPRQRGALSSSTKRNPLLSSSARTFGGARVARRALRPCVRLVVDSRREQSRREVGSLLRVSPAAGFFGDEEALDARASGRRAVRGTGSSIKGTCPRSLVTADVRFDDLSRSTPAGNRDATPERNRFEPKVISASMVRPPHEGRVANEARSNPRPSRNAASQRGATRRFARGSTTRASEETLIDLATAEHAEANGRHGNRKRVGRREARHAPDHTSRRETRRGPARPKATSFERRRREDDDS